jgi:putative tryptophan/tyrosine transport system substrate-binding protein
MMNRRTFFAIATIAVARPLAAQAQEGGKVRRIGVLGNVKNPPLEEAALQSLRERGYVEGRNLVVEWRYTGGRDELFADFAEEFVRLKVDLIVTVTNPGAQAAKKATNTIPIVMGSSVSPERIGLVATLARPAGNVTGLTLDTGPEIAGKMLQLLKETVPKISRVAVLASSPAHVWFEESGAPVREIHAAAQGLGLTLVPIVARSPNDFAGAFAAAADGRAEALIAEFSGLAFIQRRLIVEAAAKQRLPAVYPFRAFAEDGGLMAYGVDLKALYGRVAYFVDKIFKGAKPADLPVERPTKLELVVNLKTARALGLTIPPSLLLRADQVIE